jgi:hypothetical protein
MANTAGLDCLFSTVIGCSQKKKRKKAGNAFKDVALVAGT